PRVVWRNDIGTARFNNIRRREQRLNEIGEPIRIHAYVGVGVRNDFAYSFGQADVARDAQAAMRNLDEANRGVILNNFLGARVRTVIDQQHFKIRVGHSLESRETVLQRVGRLMGADDDRNSRPAAPLIVGKWTSCEYPRNRVEYRFRPSLDV